MANQKNIDPYKWKAGQSGNPKGRKKGSKNLASIVRELENEDFDWDSLPIKGTTPEVQAQLDWFKAQGAPFRALVMRAFIDATKGDKKAMEWLRKAGYGDKIDVTTKGKEIAQPLIVSAVKARNVESEAETEEGN